VAREARRVDQGYGVGEAITLPLMSCIGMVPRRAGAAQINVGFGGASKWFEDVSDANIRERW
jgi:hypothetical protein